MLNTIKVGIFANHNLYEMQRVILHRTIDRQNGKQSKVILRNVLKKVLLDQKAKNQPRVYRNDLCTAPDQFIHEYPNGRRMLIKQIRYTAEEVVLCEL